MRKIVFLFIFISINVSSFAQNIFDVARHGKINEMEHLINQGIDINQKNKAGYTPLILACYYNNEEIVSLLLNKNANMEVMSEMGTALLAASYKGFNNIVKLLIKYKANINASDSKGTTALHYACFSQNIELVKILTGQNIKLHAKDINNKTPLDYAIEFNNIEILKLLQPNNN